MLARVCAALALLGAGPTAALGGNPGDDHRPVPVYTNDDLDRVRPLRAQTGATSVPAAASVSPPPAAGSPPPLGRGQAYWRREAERLADRLAPLAERAAQLQERLAERRRRPGVRPHTDPQLAAWQAQLERLQARMRAMEERLHDRARREGALPGWLR